MNFQKVDRENLLLWSKMELVKEFDAKILSHLTSMKKRRRVSVGICPNLDSSYKWNEAWDEDRVDAYCVYVKYRLEDLFPKWPLYSGDINYPVPHPTTTPEDAYLQLEDKNMWDRRTEYGRNRWNLLDFLIAELTKSVTTDNP